ncbi:MAG: rhomboid family intramembrane serine protease [Deltaproteobacteria bacterium]|nr:rhomboid family intramembrane serine protease [Deltaproteobacteria bacterium]MBW2019633.1 rhomboid family intramembrane serine protease [Deltaproteobacteria bacterium]MBW2074448.1 rhomboid family intramembrane serine protease [Deltaproteobacteria bacterium]RLB82386.1 MAG: rhomboid family intramembrane serine protease [Deltaproteobacteria bacterium]
MIPIRDTIRSETYPVVNNVIIAINVLVFLIELSQGQRLHEFIYVYGLVPARYGVPQISAYFTTGQQVFSFLTFMFLHGGFFHLLGNMWSLYIFGDNVEDRLGHIRYLLFYLLCGLASGISHLVINWYSEIPTIGASGAIAGVMGAYFVLYPRAKVLTLVPIFFFFQFLEIPAFLFLGVWLLFQFLSAAGTSAQAGGIAWWAHIGGFIFGIIFLKLFEMFPKMGVGRRVRDLTRKRTTPRLQVIRPVGLGTDPDLYGVIPITEREALFGTRKLVNIPEGLKKRTFFLTIPPGVSEGSTLRLKGMGRRLAEDVQGDLYLKVQIRG